MVVRRHQRLGKILVESRKAPTHFICSHHSLLSEHRRHPTPTRRLVPLARPSDWMGVISRFSINLVTPLKLGREKVRTNFHLSGRVSPASFPVDRLERTRSRSRMSLLQTEPSLSGSGRKMWDTLTSSRGIIVFYFSKG